MFLNVSAPFLQTQLHLTAPHIYLLNLFIAGFQPKCSTDTLSFCRVSVFSSPLPMNKLSPLNFFRFSSL